MQDTIQQNKDSEGAMIQQMATKETQIKPEAADVFSDLQICDRCGSAETETNPLELRHVGAYGYAAFEDGPPEYWMECAACKAKDDEVIF